MPADLTVPVLHAPPACAGDPELFFPMPSQVVQIAAAKRVCEGCPVRRDCLAFALTHAVHGIWGGTTEAERAQIQREHGLPRRVGWSTGHLAGAIDSDTYSTTTDPTSED